MKVLFITSIRYQDDVAPYRNAVLSVSEALAAQGELPIVAMDTGGESIELDYTIVVDSEASLQECLSGNQWDAVVAVGGPDIRQHQLLMNPTLKGAAKVMWCTGAPLIYHIPDAEDITYIVGSGYHRKLLCQDYQYPEDQVKTIPNPLVLPDMGSFTKHWTSRFCYMSPAQNGLHRMLDIWPLILEQEPDASLLIGCRVNEVLDGAVWSHSRDGDNARKVRELLTLPNVTQEDMTFPDQIQAMLGSVLAYPLDPVIPSDMTGELVYQACYLGTPVVCSNQDSLAELSEIATVLPIDNPQVWADMLLGASGAGVKEGVRDTIESELSPATIVQDWLTLLYGAVEGSDYHDGPGKAEA